MRKIWYEEEKDFIEMLKQEWIDELKGDYETNRKVKRLNDEEKGDEAKDMKLLRNEVKKEAKKTQIELEKTGKFKPSSQLEAALDTTGMTDAQKMMQAMGLSQEQLNMLAGGQIDKSLCAGCNKVKGKSQCSKCLEVSYCGRECQVGHWKAHKKFCKEMCASKADAAQCALATEAVLGKDAKDKEAAEKEAEKK